MKITEVQCKTFRSWAGATISLNAPRVLVGGQNGTGKSGLRDCLAWVLSGDVPDLSGKGSGGELLVPDWTGVNDVTASVVIDGIGRVERNWTPQGQQLRVTGWTGNLTDQQAALYDKLGLSEAVLRVLVDARAFLRLDHADAKRLLLGLFNVTVPIETNDGQGPLNLTLDQLETAYKQKFEDRKAAKIRLKNLPPAVEPVSGPTYHPVEKYESMLVDLRSQLAESAKAIGETLGQRTVLQRSRAQLLTSKRNISGLSPDYLDPQIKALQDELALLDSVEPAAVPGERSEQRVEFLRSRIEALKAHKPASGCVLDGDVPCETAKIKFTNQAKAYQAELDAMPAASGPKKPSLKDELETKLAILQGAVADWANATAHNASMDRQVAEVDAELGALPDVSEGEAAIKALEVRIVKGEGVTRDARAFYAARTRYQEALQAQQAASGEVDRLERLCDLLGPSGARVEALGAALGAFEAKINPYLKPFGWKIAIQAEPWAVKVNRRLVQTYSASERYRIGVALQLAIAQVSGVSFAVVDELDILDKETNRIMGRMLYESEIEQIIILSTRNHEVALPKLTDTLSYRLGIDGGRSSVVEKVEGERTAS